jgi:hypothetical protein
MREHVFGTDFPRVPASLSRRYGVREPRLGPLGRSRALLEVDLAEQERSVLVTRLIAAGSRQGAGARVPVRFIWRMPAGARISALLRLGAMEGAAPPSINFCCPQCATHIATDLDLAHIATLHDEGRVVPTPAVDVRLGTGPVRLRLPNGLHERRIARAPGLSAIDLASLLVIEGSCPRHDDLSVIDDALAEIDPLVDYRCLAICCDCGASTSRAVDLEHVAIGVLRRAQRELMGDVHALASTYHWSEASICALPRWRRAAYLEKVTREKW